MATPGAGKTPCGARPNRRGERPGSLVPSGRLLDPGSNTGTRGMIAAARRLLCSLCAVQNPAYRLARLFSISYRPLCLNSPETRQLAAKKGLAKKIKIWYYYHSRYRICRRLVGLPGGYERHLSLTNGPHLKRRSGCLGVQKALPRAGSEPQSTSPFRDKRSSFSNLKESELFVSLQQSEKLTITEFASLLGLDPNAVQAAIDNRGSSIPKAFFTIQELASRWGCSRGSVYNYLRDASARVVDFAGKGKKGKKLVPLEAVERIERQRTKRMS